MHKPYTYLIGWPEHDLFYYGVRYRKGCDPSDLWTKYFTSSKYVAEARLNYGEPTIIQIRRVFDDEVSARSWETRVLTKVDAMRNPRFLNRTNIQGRPPEKSPEHIEKIASRLRGQTRSPEQRAKMPGSKGKTWKLSEETRKKMSTSMTGIKKPEGFGQAVSDRMKGRIQSEEERNKRKTSLTGKPKSPEHIRAVIEAKRAKFLARQAALLE